MLGDPKGDEMNKHYIIGQPRLHALFKRIRKEVSSRMTPRLILKTGLRALSSNTPLELTRAIQRAQMRAYVRRTKLARHRADVPALTRNQLNWMFALFGLLFCFVTFVLLFGAFIDYLK